MLKRPINRLEKLARAKLRWRRLAAARVADADLIRVEAVVVSCIPEFQLVIVRTLEQDQYALTLDTADIDLATLHEGEKVACFITPGWPRVVRAEVICP